MAPSNGTSTEPLGSLCFNLHISAVLAFKEIHFQTRGKSPIEHKDLLLPDTSGPHGKKRIHHSGGVSDPGHQCHCVTMATGMHWLLLFSVSGWEQLRSNHSANTVVNANIKRSERVLLGEAASFH